MRSPGFYADYPSSMVSRYYCWTRDMGYEMLDVVEYPDGEKALIQYFQKPIIPSLTKWGFVLTKIRNQELTYDWIKAWAEQLDLERRVVWERQAAVEKEAIRRQDEEERRAQDFANRAHFSIINNPDLMERIGKRGLGEMNPLKVLNNISRSKLGRGYRENKLYS